MALPISTTTIIIVLVAIIVSQSAVMMMMMMTTTTMTHLATDAQRTAADGGGTAVHLRRISEMRASDFGRKGLAHVSIWSHREHGLNEVEVWQQTFSAGVYVHLRTHASIRFAHEEDAHTKNLTNHHLLIDTRSSTPIHSHDCEELFIVTNTTGATDARIEWRTPPAPGAEKGTFPVHESRALTMNDTFSIEPSVVHRISVRRGEITVLVVLGRPPMDALIYGDWQQSGANAERSFPYLFDRQDAQRAGGDGGDDGGDHGIDEDDL